MNWHDELIHYGTQINYGLSVTGGIEKITYYLKGGAFVDQSIVELSGVPQNEGYKLIIIG